MITSVDSSNVCEKGEVARINGCSSTYAGTPPPTQHNHGNIGNGISK